MSDLLAVAERNQKRAWQIMEETGIIGIWESRGAEINLVGSLKTGLLMHNLDIDFHVYSDPFVLADSFAAMAALAQNSRIRRIEYMNLLDTDEKCLEWHAWYQADGGEPWRMDLIHILKDSRYAGYFETVAERIRAALTPETRRAILAIKDAGIHGPKVMSIRIYQAVLRDGVRNHEEFQQWAKDHPEEGVIDWMP